MKISLPSKEIILITCIILIAAIASLTQTIVYWLYTPDGTVYLFGHNYLEDYYYYIHLIRQGYDGSLLATSKLTPEIYPPQFVNLWFLGAGHIARGLHISLPLIYTLSRVFGAISLLTLSYLCIRRVYSQPHKKIIALLCVAFGTFWISRDSNGISVPELVRSWTELDPLFRLSYIPHHLASKVFFVLSLYLLSSNLKAAWKLCVLAMSIFLAGMSSPTILAIFVPLCIVWFALELWTQKNLSKLAPLGFFLILALILSLGIIWHHRGVQHSVFPWTASYITWENTMRYPITLGNFVQSLGPTFFLFLVATPWLVRHNRTTRLLVAWVGAGFLLLFGIGQFIPLANSRYLGGYYFIPLGIASTQGLIILGTWLSRLLHIPKAATNWTLVVVLFGYFGIALHTTWQLHRQYIDQNMHNPQVYTPVDVVDALSFLERTVKPDEVILAPPNISTMIPAFTSGRSVMGHVLMSIENDKRKEEVERFYSYVVTPNDTEKLFDRLRVSYVIEQRNSPVSIAFFQRLPVTKVYENTSVVVYKRN